MGFKHFAKATLGLAVLFLGLQFGHDLAAKVSTSMAAGTPAS